MAARKKASSKSSLQSGLRKTQPNASYADSANLSLAHASSDEPASFRSPLSDDEYFAQLKTSPGLLDLTRKNPRIDIAEDVISLRRRLGMTQTDLAHALNTQQPSVARIESGLANPTVQTLWEYATALDAYLRIRLIPIHEYMTGETSPAWFDHGVLGKTVLSVPTGGQIQVSYHVGPYVATADEHDLVDYGPTAPLEVGNTSHQLLIGTEK